MKEGAVPAIKDPGHDSELEMVGEMASNVCGLLAIGAQVLVTPSTHIKPTLHIIGL